MTSKRCPTCKQEKPITDFYKNRSRKDGLSIQCKVCHVAERRERRRRNPEKTRLESKAWRDKNPEHARKIKRLARGRRKDHYNAQQQQWRENNPDKRKVYYLRRKDAVQQWQREHYDEIKNQPQYILCNRMRARIYYALHCLKDKRSWKSLVGYGVKELTKHLKKTMPQGYTWDDFLAGKLHIDHIIPVAAFNFQTAEDIDFKRCWSLKNLRLLPAQDNIIKSDKLEKPFQPSLALAV